MRIAARFAYAAAILFAVHLVTYFIPAVRDATLANAPVLAVALAVVAIAQHAVVFPVAALLPAPGWARIAAYVWLIGDIISDVMQMAGSPVSQYLTLRLFVNVLAAVWMVAASWRAPTAMRIVGIFVAVDLVTYSLTATLSRLAFLVALPSLILAPLWFWLVARYLMALAESRTS
jgi:hypothetical protein